jgi:uncharacterized protein
MRDNNNLFIDLSKIARNDGAFISVSKEFSPAVFEKFDPGFAKTVSNVSFSGTVTNMAGNLNIAGLLVFEINVECDRCLTHFTKLYEIEFSDIIAKDDAGLAGGEYIPYSNNRADITEAVYQAVFFAVSERHLCKPDCKGLCSGCGCDLNVTRCGCGDYGIDPRLTKLKDLL